MLTQRRRRWASIRKNLVQTLRVSARRIRLPMLVHCCASVVDGRPTLNQYWVNVLCLLGAVDVTPVAETGFSHRLTAYKIVEPFLELSYLKISGNNQVENSSFRISNISVPCSHAQLRGRTVIKKLWSFFGP